MSEKEYEGEDLRNFVSKSLQSILAGIAEAYDATAPKPFTMYGTLDGKYPAKVRFGLGHPSSVEFDIAVTVERASSKEGAAEIKIMGIGLGGGASGENKNAVVTRLKFAVPVFSRDEEREQKREKTKERLEGLTGKSAKNDEEADK